MPISKNYTGATIIAFAMILFWAFVYPYYHRISELDTAIKDRQDLLDLRKATVANIKSINDEYQKRTLEVKKISSIIPAKKSIAEVVSTLEDISNKNGVELFSSSVTGLKQEASKNPHGTLSIDLALSGNYPSLVNFLKGLERSLRLVDIASIDAALEAGDKTSLTFSVKGSAYYLK